MHRTSPPPPVNLAMPNMPSLMSALPRELRQAAAGPPPRVHAKLGFTNFAKGEIDRFVAALDTRAKAVSGGGAKPPYGGDRNPLAFADMPEPGRGFGQGRMPLKPDDGMFTKALDGAWGMIGRRRLPRVHVVEGDRSILATRAKWSEAEVRLLDPESTMLIHSPEHAGFVQIIEVRVPIEVASGPKSLIMWMKAWFKERLAKDTADKLSANVTTVIKQGAPIDTEAAAARVKALIKDDYKAEDTWFHIQLEGANSVTVVEAPQPMSERSRG